MDTMKVVKFIGLSLVIMSCYLMLGFEMTVLAVLAAILWEEQEV